MDSLPVITDPLQHPPPHIRRQSPLMKECNKCSNNSQLSTQNDYKMSILEKQLGTNQTTHEMEEEAIKQLILL